MSGFNDVIWDFNRVVFYPNLMSGFNERIGDLIGGFFILKPVLSHTIFGRLQKNREPKVPYLKLFKVSQNDSTSVMLGSCSQYQNEIKIFCRTLTKVSYLNSD